MATTFTIASAADKFPVGTTVSVYPANSVRPGSAHTPAGVAAITSAVVAANGSLAFSGLPDRTPLVAHANVGGVDRVIGINTWT
jgi:hypothetical protein